MLNRIGKLARFYRDNPLSFRVLKMILAVSTVFAIITTAVQIYTNYSIDISELNERLSDLEDSSVPSLRESLWKFDMPSVRSTVQAIQRLPYIAVVSLQVADGDAIETGTPDRTEYRIKRIGIDYQLPNGETVALGTLTLFIDESAIFDSLLIQLRVTLLAQLLKTFSVSIFIIIVLHFLIMRHMATLAAFADRMSLQSLGSPISLHRETAPKHKRDELDKLSGSMESMRVRLLEDLETIQHARETEQKLIGAIEASPTGVLIASPDGGLEYANETFRKTAGVAEADLAGRKLRDISEEWLPRPTGRDTFAEIIDHVLLHGQWSGEAVGKGPDGESRWNYMVVSTIRTPEGGTSHILVIIDDITDLKQSEDNLFRQQHFDETTRLPNRNYAFERLISILNQGGSRQDEVAVIVLSIKEYRSVKETFGERMAEQLMFELASHVQGVMTGAGLYARTGEQELLVCMDNIHSREVIELELRKLSLQFVKPVEVEGKLIPVSIYAGVALFPLDGDSGQELYRNALLAMNRARSSPMNFQFYREELSQSISREFSIVMALRSAIIDNELGPWYQPIVDARTGTIHGLEVLIRWKNAALGNISPVEFISIAEKTGDIVPIGKWILARSIREISALPGSELLSLSVNISPVQLLSPSFESDVRAVLKETGVNPAQLKFEITEESLIEQVDEIREKIDFIRHLGGQVVLDDFGTGYSSLSYLQSLPFNVIKIDKSFIMSMEDNIRNRRLVRTIIDLAHDLGMKVTAEGVETAAHVATLCEYGCDYLQGYYYSRPVPVGDLADILTRKQLTGR